MADASVLCIALTKAELPKELTKDDRKEGLQYIGYGYQSSEVYLWKIEKWNKDNYFGTTEETLSIDEEDKIAVEALSLYGITIAETWNGAICLEEIEDGIKKAKELFKSITGKEGRIYFIGSQT